MDDGVLERRNWPITEVVLGALAAVVVVCSGQRHRHRRERRLDGDDGAEQKGEDMQEYRNEVDEPVWQVVLRRGIAESDKKVTHERPEVDRLIICYVVSLK